MRYIDKINVTVLLGLILATWTGCSTHGPGVTGSGTIEATDLIISAEITGTILTMDIDEGDDLSAGDIIAEIDTEHIVLERAATAASLAEIDAMEMEVSARVKQARTALSGAEKTYKRARKLRGKGSISQQAYDDLETAYHMSLRQQDTARAALGAFPARRSTVQARLKILDYKISKGTVRAPINGTIIEIYANAGEQIAVMRPLVKIADLSRVTVKIYISEPDLGRVKLGGAAKVQVDSAPGEWLSGTVSRVADEAEFTPKNVQTRDARADLVYAVKISLDNPEGILKIGMPVDVCLEGFPEFDHPGEPIPGKRSWNPFQ